MKMRDEDVCVNRARLEFVAESLSQDAKAGPAVEDIKAVAEAHFHARGVASVAHIFRLSGRCGSANSPELDSHTRPLTKYSQTVILRLGTESVNSFAGSRGQFDDGHSCRRLELCLRSGF